METAVITLIGLVAGVLGGLLGVGGSVVMIPALTELLGPSPHRYQAAAMIVNFFVVAPALIQHARKKAIIFSIVNRMAPAAGVAVVVGVWTSERSFFLHGGQSTLILIFGLFLLWVAGRQVFSLRSASEDSNGRIADPKLEGWRAALMIGLPMGFVAGLLGVGGGVVCVPFQTRFLRIPMRQAIANSAATILLLSLIGAILKNTAIAVHHHDVALNDSLVLAATLIPPAIIGSMIGSRLTHVLPAKALRIVLIALLLAASARMIAISFHASTPTHEPSAATHVPTPP
ncbi:MAG: sulfite exporter TauE/SafE family protein [Planctomycetes bacterium]|nr:sulfite exporter TauE/SafE family protein [Planctomycetota bacterium]